MQITGNIDTLRQLFILMPQIITYGQLRRSLRLKDARTRLTKRMRREPQLRKPKRITIQPQMLVQQIRLTNIPIRQRKHQIMLTATTIAHLLLMPPP